MTKRSRTIAILVAVPAMLAATPIPGLPIVAAAQPASGSSNAPIPVVLLRHRPVCTPGWTVKVFFIRNEAQVSDAIAGLIVDDTAREVLACRPRRVVIEEHRDLGEAVTLGTERARTIQRELTGRWVRRGALTLRDAGASRPIVTPPSVQNRRVLLMFKYS